MLFDDVEPGVSELRRRYGLGDGRRVILYAPTFRGDRVTDATDGLPDQYTVYLFDRCFENYFWNYDNNGLKNLELRFYAAG